MTFIIQWIDVIWLPLAFFAVHKHQRFWAIGLVAACMLMMRLQIEFMNGIGFEHGIVGLMSSHILYRALVVYSLFYMLFLMLAHYSPHTQRAVVMAAAISMFFMSFFVSTLVMVL